MKSAIISLWVNACVAGTLHGAPTEICHEFQINHYRDVAACEAAVKTHPEQDWLKSLEVFHLVLRVATIRCGPADLDSNDI